MKTPNNFKYDFCKLYFHMTDGNFTYKFTDILKLLNYKVDNSNPGGVIQSLVKKYGLLIRKDIKFLRTKRFVDKSFYVCPVSGETTDYLFGDTKNDYYKAERNLISAFSSGRLLRKAAAMKANSKLSNRKLKLRFLLESTKNKTICSRCVEVKDWDEMIGYNGDKQRACKSCVQPILREGARKREEKKRNSLPPGEHAKKLREYLNNNPDKKVKYRKKSAETFKKGRLEGKYKYPNNPMITQIYRLIRRCEKQLGTTKETNAIKELGFNPKELKERLGVKYNLTDHVDHNIPVNWFKDGTPFSIVNNLNNLKYVSKEYNLTKQNFWFDNITVEFYHIAKQYIKDIFLERFIINGEVVKDCFYGVYEPKYFIRVYV
jgi:hypothetical protein